MTENKIPCFAETRFDLSFAMSGDLATAIASFEAFFNSLDRLGDPQERGFSDAELIELLRLAVSRLSILNAPKYQSLQIKVLEKLAQLSSYDEGSA